MLLAPDLIVTEVCNAAWSKLRRGEIAPEQAAAMVEGLPDLLDELAPSAPLAGRALAIANALAHPADDCFYLALAELRGAQMVTDDRRLLARLATTPWARTVMKLETTREGLSRQSKAARGSTAVAQARPSERAASRPDARQTASLGFARRTRVPYAPCRKGDPTWTATSTPSSASRRTTMRRSPTCSARATTTRRSATPRPIAGRTTSRRRSRRSASRSPPSRVTIVTTAAPYRPDKGDQGPGAPYNGGAKFYQVYSGDTSQQHDLRISHIGYDRTHTSAEDSGTWFPLPALLRAARPGPHRRRHAALPWRAHQPQPPRHGGDRRAGDPAPLPRRRRRCRHPGAELPGLPPDVQPGRAPSGGERHPHRGHGLRQGHRRARRGAALPVQRLPARQQRRQAARRGLAGPHAGTGAARAGGRAGAAHHDAVAAALERGCVVEARLPEPGPHRARGTGPPPPRVRRAEGGRARNCAWRRRRDARRPPVRQRPRPRLHPGARRAVWQLPARAARRRCDQGRAPRGRGHAPHAAVARMGRPRHGAGVAGDQRQQAQPDARPAEAGGDRHRQPSRRARPTW